MAKKKRKAKATSYTICDSCIHAYGDDCFSVPPEERYWVKEVAVKPSSSGNFTIRNVQKCERYKRGRKPLPGIVPNRCRYWTTEVSSNQKE